MPILLITKKKSIKEFIHFKMQPFPSRFKAVSDPARACTVHFRPLGLCGYLVTAAMFAQQQPRKLHTGFWGNLTIYFLYLTGNEAPFRRFSDQS